MGRSTWWSWRTARPRGCAASLRPGARARPLYPWGAGLGERPRIRTGAFAGALRQRYDGASTMMGVLPIGAGPDGERDLVSVSSGPSRWPRWDAFFAGNLAAWVERARNLERLAGDANLCSASSPQPDAFSRAIYRDVSAGVGMPAPLSSSETRRYGTSPQLGQGANLGLIDAVELAERVGAPAHLPAYQRARRRCRPRPIS